MTHLSLAQNDLGDAGAVALAKALVVYRVTHVNVNGNSIGDEGAEAFANALRANTTLTVRFRAPVQQRAEGHGGPAVGKKKRRIIQNELKSRPQRGFELKGSVFGGVQYI